MFKSFKHELLIKQPTKRTTAAALGACVMQRQFYFLFLFPCKWPFLTLLTIAQMCLNPPPVCTFAAQLWARQAGPLLKVVSQGSALWHHKSAVTPLFKPLVAPIVAQNVLVRGFLLGAEIGIPTLPLASICGQLTKPLCNSACSSIKWRWSQCPSHWTVVRMKRQNRMVPGAQRIAVLAIGGHQV